VGRTWWAHFEFTRINIEPIILKNKIEDAREAGALTSIGGRTAEVACVTFISILPVARLALLQRMFVREARRCASPTGRCIGCG
jgi:hypothetical protein